jgi:hypothetical protein
VKSLESRSGGDLNAGAQAVSEHGSTKLGSNEPSSSDLRIQGIWNGKAVRQLFESSSSATANDEARRLFVEHERVVEDRFRHDDVPGEYQEAVRAYFAALRQRESPWMQTKK